MAGSLASTSAAASSEKARSTSAAASSEKTRSTSSAKTRSTSAVSSASASPPSGARPGSSPLHGSVPSAGSRHGSASRPTSTRVKFIKVSPQTTSSSTCYDLTTLGLKLVFIYPNKPTKAWSCFGKSSAEAKLKELKSHEQHRKPLDHKRTAAVKLEVLDQIQSGKVKVCGRGKELVSEVDFPLLVGPPHVLKAGELSQRQMPFSPNSSGRRDSEKKAEMRASRLEKLNNSLEECDARLN